MSTMTDEAAELIAVKTTDKYGYADRYGVVIYTNQDSNGDLRWNFVRSGNLNSSEHDMCLYATVLIKELESLLGKDTVRLVKAVLKEIKDGAKH